MQNRLKKLGFTISEVMMALLVVGILSAITVPIVNNQMEKNKEYSYYLAYKTVEKMAAQILLKNKFADADIQNSYKISKNDGVKSFFLNLIPYAAAYDVGKCKGDDSCYATNWYNYSWNGSSCIKPNSYCEDVEHSRIISTQSTTGHNILCTRPDDEAKYKVYAYRAPDKDEGRSDTYQCIQCSSDRAFDRSNGKCCTINDSIYKNGQCECKPGYELRSGKCVLSPCKEGYRKETVTKEDGSTEDICALNPALNKYKEFCQAIEGTWNVKEANCGGAAASRSEILAAASSTDGKYLSAESKPKGFDGIKPDIIFPTGQRLWILNDRSVSIPGLSRKTTPDEGAPINPTCVTIGTGGYLCDAEATRYKDPADSMLSDARPCCLIKNTDTVLEEDPTDSIVMAISGFTVFVDIDGDSKSSSTLWDDVFPFFIATDGNVYPGYPLDGKDEAKYFGGNSEKYLPTDVYYYTTETNSAGKKIRVKKTLLSSVSYARAMCSARQISKATVYCLNIGEDFHGGKYTYKKDDGTDGTISLDGTDYINGTSPCDIENCQVSIRRKLKTF